MRTWRWQRAAWWTACLPGRGTSRWSSGSAAQLWQHVAAQPLPLKVGQQVRHLLARGRRQQAGGQLWQSAAAQLRPLSGADVCVSCRRLAAGLLGSLALLLGGEWAYTRRQGLSLAPASVKWRSPAWQ